MLRCKLGAFARQYASVPANTGLGRIGEFWGFARKQRGSDEVRQEAKLKFTCKLCLYIYNHITQSNNDITSFPKEITYLKTIQNFRIHLQMIFLSFLHRNPCRYVTFSNYEKVT